ncbi:MAG TPA: lactate permease LctP family transporter [Terriglobia bacterium]|nr:lactate permease LctP family transporter [Terriglobia bacterium]
MWQQNYTPIARSLALSATFASLPILALLFTLGVRRIAAWKAALTGLGLAALVALLVYHMPVLTTFSAIAYGAAFGLFPISWIVFWAIVLYRVSLESGKFEVIKDSIGNLTRDPHLQALLIAFALGAFIEGACGFGTPVAVAAAMLTGLGFTPFYAACICLLANTAPVAFGSLGLPLVTLAGVTGLELHKLSSDVGRICAPISVIIPSYLVKIMGGWGALRRVLLATLVCGISFAGAQMFVSNFIGPYLTDIIASITAITALIILFQVWEPSKLAPTTSVGGRVKKIKLRAADIITAWSPYGLLVVLVLVWGLNSVQNWLNSATWVFDWPFLHNQVWRVPPVVTIASPYAAKYTFNSLSISGTACMIAALGSSLILKMPLSQTMQIITSTTRQLFHTILTIAAVVAMAFLMNYSGATVTLALALAATGAAFPFFSPLLGWLGVFLSGSDTASNALFGNLQVITANQLGVNPVLMAAANSSGGVMGKMISLQSIAVAAAATGLQSADEGRLFRFTLKHSVGLIALVGLITLFYTYVMPNWVL